VHVYEFVAAADANHGGPGYLASGQSNPRPSVRTVSNAMDVGNPSNFERILNIFAESFEDIKSNIDGKHYTDEETKAIITAVHKEQGYILDPHSAIGYKGLKDYLAEEGKDLNGVFLS